MPLTIVTARYAPRHSFVRPGLHRALDAEAFEELQKLAGG
jgi:hypothetical protein